MGSKQTPLQNADNSLGLGVPLHVLMLFDMFNEVQLTTNKW